MSAYRTDEPAAVAASLPAPVLDPDNDRIAGPTLEARFRKRLAAPERDFVLEAEFQAAPGFTILFGPSGAGKTTLLDCVAGLSTPDAGRIAIGDRVLFDSSQRIAVQTAKRRTGYVLQSLALFPHMTVEQNLGYGLKHLPHTERARRVESI